MPSNQILDFLAFNEFNLLLNERNYFGSDAYFKLLKDVRFVLKT